MAPTERNTRQADMFPETRLESCEATVVGVGAIGRQVALQLSAVGVHRLNLVDFDCVEEANLGPQAYQFEDVGSTKVEATEAACKSLNPDLIVIPLLDKFRGKKTPFGDALFCCVDSIETRGVIWRSVNRQVGFFCDGRMAAEVTRILTVTDENEAGEHYAGTLFDPSEAVQEGCTAKSTVFCANIAAGLMVSQFSRWLRGLPTDQDVCLNLLSSEMMVG